MNKVLASIFITLFSISSSYAASCEENVDKVKIFYVNGMFTNYQKFGANKAHLMGFQKKYLKSDFELYPFVDGSYNNTEVFYQQFQQVALQKYEEAGPIEKEIIKKLLRGTVDAFNDQDSEVSKLLITKIFSELDRYVIVGDSDFSTAKVRLTSNLNQCARVILVGHSQGNFYSNGLLESLYNEYMHKDGSSISTYPMLSYMGIALPTSVAGGSVGVARPDLIGHITNDNDYIMSAVRNNIGAVPANYDASFNFSDWTGHGLTESYLIPSGQAAVISNHMKRIASNLVPPSLHKQVSVSSSAINSIGYSKISQVLDVEFSDNDVYRYEGVPENVWNNFQSASSKGKFFNINIKNSYSFTKLN
ncbi:KTSC domain-containing protein [Vibrio splendidus]|jgi:hypothetical protein|uniref:KTSC domain-containing protein n=1 Tax=Vibrio splendidus TaxID=29497 RepID=A0AB35MVD6_VIBSP|nr:KTSC domain-containing protein [Vibrio splendidus]MDP2500142.1 KTSC domain-containing protein [Vibrio splendidus]